MEHLPKSLGGLISCWSKKGWSSSSLYSVYPVIRKWLKNFVFRDVWLLSMNNNTLGQICSTDCSSCGRDRKIYHLCSQAATPDLKVRSQRTRRYWGKVLVWKHNYTWVFLAWHEDKSPGANSILLKCTMCQALWVAFFPDEEKLAELGLVNCSWPKRPMHNPGSFSGVMRWEGEAGALYIEHLTSQISGSPWALVPSKLNPGNFTLITGPIIFPYYNLLRVQPNYVKL